MIFLNALTETSPSYRKMKTRESSNIKIHDNKIVYIT